MQNYLKFLAKLPKGLRKRVILAVEKILLNQLKELDIKPITSKGSFYRCRVGKVRIIFRKVQPENEIFDIGFRGDVYKNLK